MKFSLGGPGRNLDTSGHDFSEAHELQESLTTGRRLATNRKILEIGTNLGESGRRPLLHFGGLGPGPVEGGMSHAFPPGSHVFQPTGIIFELVQDIIGINLQTKFHEDRTVNVASRVLTRFYLSHIRTNAPPLGSHIFQANIIIFKFIQDIIAINLLTRFHENWTINVASRVLTRNKSCHHRMTYAPYKRLTDVQCENYIPLFFERGHKNATPLVAMFKATKTIFELIQDIIGTNLLTKFHDDRKINVTTRKMPRPQSGHVFQPTSIIFELVQDIIGMNILTKFREDLTINVASTMKNAPPLGSHVFQANFHEDRKINVACRFHIWKNAPPLGGHVFQLTGIIFKLVQYIIGMNLLIKFHEDRKINVASRVLTRNMPRPWRPYRTKHVASRMKNAPPFGSHIFQTKIFAIFEFIQDIIGTNLLSKFHEDRNINVASRVLTRKKAPPPGVHVFQPTGFIFELVQDIIRMNLLTKFHEEQTTNVASRGKNDPPLGSHVFQANVTIFQLIQDIIEKNLLTECLEDWTINVASRELTRQMLTPHNAQRTTHDGQKAITKAHNEHVVLRSAKNIQYINITCLTG
ncbi:hypothetical protein DPMN_044260 [Dreissena polymorpha]|uniref:Uncharacterized protein n=1 Tax=Dreissena polymorpha TaxID=45954 RepID=A0A9D4D3V4_DREPO|nr:hypothetical protein DPMN_044260 [Dreissena polymorpha]